MKVTSILGVMAGVVAAAAPAARAEILNGSFQNGLDDWQTRGTVITAVNVYGNVAVMLREEGSGGLSRLYQEFTLPAIEPEAEKGTSLIVDNGS